MYSAVVSMCCISVLYCMPYAVSLCPIVCCFSVQIVCCIRLLYCMLYQCAILCAVSVCCIDCCISVVYCMLCQCTRLYAVWYIVCCIRVLYCVLFDWQDWCVYWSRQPPQFPALHDAVCVLRLLWCPPLHDNTLYS